MGGAVKQSVTLTHSGAKYRVKLNIPESADSLGLTKSPCASGKKKRELTFKHFEIIIKLD